MPANGLSTGIDYKISYTDANGNLNFEILESMTSKEDAVANKAIAMDGTVRHPKFHQGWSGTIVFQKDSSFLDDYFAQQESDYYLGGDQIPITITETVTFEDSTVKQYQYTNVVLIFDDTGTRSGTDFVKQTVQFLGSRRLVVA